MLENLFNLIKEQGNETVISNPVIPNEQNDAVLASATSSVAEEFQGTLAGGGLQNVLSMFGQNSSNSGDGFMNNPIVRNIIGNFTQKLTNNHGISGDQASGIAGNLIPNVLRNLISKTNDPNDSNFDINSIISSLTGGTAAQAGGSGFDFNGIISRFTNGGLDTDGDGKVELSDIISKVTGGAQQAQTGQSGGLMDMIKGFMK